MVQGRRRKLSYKSEYIASVPREEWFIVENTHEPIIDTAMFKAVQEMMKSKKRNTQIKGID